MRLGVNLLSLHALIARLPLRRRGRIQRVIELEASILLEQPHEEECGLVVRKLCGTNMQY